jgi:hypothetical protein
MTTADPVTLSEDTVRQIEETAQAAERERISELVRTMGGPEAVELLEKINES